MWIKNDAIMKIKQGLCICLFSVNNILSYYVVFDTPVFQYIFTNFVSGRNVQAITSKASH